MSNLPKRNYDKTDVYNEKIVPLLDQLEKICTKEQIPFFFSAAVANNEETTSYEQRARTAAPMGFGITKDLLVEHVKVCAGFEVVVSETLPEIHL